MALYVQSWGVLHLWVMQELFSPFGYRVVLAEAAKILANLIVMGSGIVGRAFLQSYCRVLANASQSGVAQETINNIKRGSKTMTEVGARQILGITEHASWEEIMQRYDNLFEQNAKNGSFYLQLFIGLKNAWKQFWMLREVPRRNLERVSLCS